MNSGGCHVKSQVAETEVQSLADKEKIPNSNLSNFKP
jgi:hypothetical protein